MREGWTYKKFEDCLVKAPKAKQVQTSEYNAGSKYPIISQEDKMISGYCDDSSLLYHIDCPIVIFGDHTRVLKYVDFDFVVGADGVKILIPKDFLRAKYLFYYLQWYKIPSLGYSRHYKLLKEINIPVPPLSEQQRIVSELDLLSSIIEKKKAQLKEYDQLAQSIFYDMFGDPITNEKGWEVKKLGEVCEVTSSKRIFANEYTSSGIPFYRGKEITEKSKGMPLSIELYISEEMYKELKSIGIPQIGDVLITAVGTIGNIWVVNDNTPFYFKDGNVIWLKNIRMQNSVYFKFILEKLIEIYKQEMVRGAAYNALTIVNLKKMLVFLPPLTLQQQFAEKIEAIEKQKELIKQSITETETLFNSRMDYYFN